MSSFICHTGKSTGIFSAAGAGCIEPAGQLFDRLDNNLNLSEYFNTYRMEENLAPAVESLEKLYQPSGDSTELQKYLQDSGGAG